MSPNDWVASIACVWGVSGADDPGYLFNDFVQYGYGVRPSVSLSSCVKVNGRGTADDPYEIDESASTC